ncbi:MAG: ParA family protein [Bryobacteraceae bacterium]
MTITLLARKGGVGKSTLSILLHEAFRQANKSVSIRDWDPQGTSNRALSFINDSGVSPKQSDILIYDCPPSLDHTATAAGVMAADIALVVTTPSPADLWEADNAARFAREKNPRAILRVVFNRVRRTTVLGRLIEESAKQISAPSLNTRISARECYQHAIGQGWKALDAPAREEVLLLTADVLALMALR